MRKFYQVLFIGLVTLFISFNVGAKTSSKVPPPPSPIPDPQAQLGTAGDSSSPAEGKVLQSQAAKKRIEQKTVEGKIRKSSGNRPLSPKPKPTSDTNCITAGSCG